MRSNGLVAQLEQTRRVVVGTQSIDCAFRGPRQVVITCVKLWSCARQSEPFLDFSERFGNRRTRKQSFKSLKPRHGKVLGQAVGGRVYGGASAVPLVVASRSSSLLDQRSGILGPCMLPEEPASDRQRSIMA
jgi:hypothetical protein